MSLKNSKDAIEQLYGEEISKNFPNYEKFWGKYIGDPNSETVQPYVYKYHKTITKDEQEKIEKSFLKIQMSHYTLFCHMAGAHFQIKGLEASQKQEDDNEKYFRCCEHFEAGYMHIGSVFYVMETFWCTVLKMIGHNEGKKGLGKLAAFLAEKGRNDLALRLNDVNNNMMDRRHLPVHYSRVFVKWWQGKMYVPLNVKEEMIWSEGKKTTDWRLSDRQLASDLAQVEKLINDLHELLIKEYAYFIGTKKIVIERGGKRK